MPAREREVTKEGQIGVYSPLCWGGSGWVVVVSTTPREAAKLA